MSINFTETHGRRMLVEFKCWRCKTTAIRSYDDCLENSRDYARGLYDFKPPEGWKDGGFYYPTFCPECAEAYDRFMSGKGEGDA